MTTLTLVIFLITIFLGLPIAICLGLVGLIYIFLHGTYSYLIVIPQRMIVAVDDYGLLAIPFFILVGELMNLGGVTKRIIDLLRAVVGHRRGGIAYVNILTSGFLSSIIGSANAVAAITSKALVPEMRKDGYSNEYSSSVSATSSILGPMIPPSIVFVIYGIAASTSIGALFLAGIIPGLMIIAVFFAIAYYFARKMQVPTREKAGVKTLFSLFMKALPALLIPFIIIGGIISGKFTATEAGAIGCLLAFILGAFVYRELDIRSLPKILVRTGIVSATVLFIAAASNIFAWIMAMEKIPQMIGQSMLSISDNPLMILFIINIFLLFVGIFLETFPAILITVPVVLPVVEQFGLDPTHFGVIVCLNLIIGLITPPVGLSIYVVAGITKVSVHKLNKAMVPYLIGSIVVLFVITYIPSLVLFLPRLFGY